jgi:hypothetical protein
MPCGVWITKLKLVEAMAEVAKVVVAVQMGGVVSRGQTGIMWRSGSEGAGGGVAYVCVLSG